MAIKELKALFPDSQVFTDKETLNKYGGDWTQHYQPNPSSVVFVRSTEDVQKVVLWARKNKVNLVPSGGRTGLSAAAFATQKECVVSFERMNQILNFDSVSQIVTCQAGVITETLQNYAKEKDLFFPINFSSTGSSQIGGNIATNAGGVRVIRYGLMRQWVSGLKVVTGAGDVLSLNNSLVKNATGYDFRHLFIGSEGTLGFVTEAQIRLTTKPRPSRVMFLALPRLESVMKVFNEYQKSFQLNAYEMFTDKALEYVLKKQQVSYPLNLRSNYYVLMELEIYRSNDENEVLKKFEDLLEQKFVVDGTLDQNSHQKELLWKLRENISESLAPQKPYKNDVSVPISQIPNFLKKLSALIEESYPHFEVVYFGHIGDGNLHINILKPQTLSSDEFVNQCKKLDVLMFKVVEQFKGSISAEHGVGLTKKQFLHHTRSLEEIELMKNVKKVFDPDLIMNRGKIFDI